MERQLLTNRVELQNIAFQSESEAAAQRIDLERNTVDSIIDARTELTSLFRESFAAIPEDATNLERSREIDKTLRLRDAELETLRQTISASEERINQEERLGQLTTEDANRQRQLLDFNEQDSRIDVLESIRDRLVEIGEVTGRPNLVQRLGRELDSLRQRQQRELSQALEDNELFSLSALSEGEQRLVDDAVQTIRQEVELQRFNIDINLGFNDEALRAVIDQRFNERFSQSELEQVRFLIAPEGSEI